jgi:hypothetical protein
MVNFLEDQRLETAIGILYPGVIPAIRLLGDLTLAGSSQDRIWRRMSKPTPAA